MEVDSRKYLKLSIIISCSSMNTIVAFLEGFSNYPLKQATLKTLAFVVDVYSTNSYGAVNLNTLHVDNYPHTKNCVEK